MFQRHGERVELVGYPNHPDTKIPIFIEQLTGISNEMVADAPSFEAIAAELDELLADCLFIAHNARFDYGFLKNAFKRAGITFKPNVLCTVKLSRALFPQHRHHNLDSLVARHGLSISNRHRALPDAQLLHQFWQHIHSSVDPLLLASTLQTLVARSSLPSNIDHLRIDELPETAGVYLFYGETTCPCISVKVPISGNGCCHIFPLITVTARK